MLQILFVDSKNICRGPMAAALLNARAAREGLAAHAESAGLVVEEGDPIERLAVEVLADIGSGHELAAHRARLVRYPIVQQADLVIGVTCWHAAQLRGRFPRLATRIVALADVEGGREIIDPFLKPPAAYAGARREIERSLPGLVAFARAQRPHRRIAAAA